MRDDKPFGLQPPKMGGLDVPNWLEVDATLIVHDNPVRKIPFKYIYKPLYRFVPQHTHFKWQSVNRIEVLIDIGYNIMGGYGTYKLSAQWDVTYDDDGITLNTIVAGGPEKRTTGKFTFQAEMDVRQPTLKTDFANTIMFLKLTGSVTDDGVTVSGGPASGDVGGTYFDHQNTYRFDIAQYATGHPERPPAAVQLPTSLLKHLVTFETEDKADLSPEQVVRLEDKWIDPLWDRAPALAAAIEAGTISLRLTGHASATGKSKEHNLALSARRITSAANEIKKHFPKLVYVSIPRGQMDVQQPGPVAQEKFVKIEIDPQAASAILSKAQRQ